VGVGVETWVGRLVGWQGQWRDWWLCSLPLVAWHLHTIGIAQIHLRINLFRSKFYSGCPDTPHKFYFISYLDRIYTGFISV
jgi:hypothetical protein